MFTSPLGISGAFLVTGDVHEDGRGVFEASWESSVLAKCNIDFKPGSACHSYNKGIGTLRGLHYQKKPNAQAKLVACTSGKIFDVILDLRPDSSTYLMSSSIELSAASGSSLLIPAGCAHGFVTLEKDTTVFYLIQGKYVPESAATIRWDDPLVNVNWPISHPIISEKDRNAPDFEP